MNFALSEFALSEDSVYLVKAQINRKMPVCNTQWALEVVTSTYYILRSINACPNVQFYIQLVYKQHLGTLILLLGPFWAAQGSKKKKSLIVLK